MSIFGRRIITTTLDPVPRGLRAAPGMLAMNAREQAALSAGDKAVLREIVDVCQAEDAAEARLVLRPRPPRRCRPMSPSTRIGLLAALEPGRPQAYRRSA